MRLARAAVGLWLLFLPVSASAADWEVTVRMPCFAGTLSTDSLGCHEDSSLVETGLDSLFVRGLRFGDRDTILLGAVPVRGRECSDVDFTLSILPGTMGELFLSLQDRAGIRACSEFHQVFALPLIDPAEAARIEPWYRLVVRPWAEGR